MNTSGADEPQHKPILEDELGLEDTPQAESAETDVVSPSETNITQAAELTDGMEKPKKTDLRPWYKRPKVWGIILGVVSVLIALAIVGLWLRNRQLAQDYMSSDWRRLAAAADRVAIEAEKATYDSFGAVENSLGDMQDRLDDSLDAEAKLPKLFTDAAALRQYSATVTELKEYTVASRKLAGDLSQASESNLDELKSLATKTKLTVDDAKQEISVLKENFPDSYFTLSERMTTVISAHKSTLSEADAKAEAEKTAADQQKQNQANAEEAMASWTQAFIAGNTTEMRKYMTTAFAAEYDFGQVSPSARKFNYPTTYRRVNTEKKGDQYEIIETVTFVTKSDYAPDTTYTQNYILLIAQDSSTKKWLVNSQRYGQ
jgi:hypothetical protein